MLFKTVPILNYTNPGKKLSEEKIGLGTIAFLFTIRFSLCELYAGHVLILMTFMI